MLKIGDRLLSLEDFKRHRQQVQKTGSNKQQRRRRHERHMAAQSRRKADRLARRGLRPPLVCRNGLPFCVFGANGETVARDRGPICIYALIDPRDNTVRYIGKTSSPQHRLRQHIEQESKGRKFKWVTEMKASGVLPRMEILERVPIFEWEAAERRWIAFYSNHGSILNVEIGGRGYLHRYNLEQSYKRKRRPISVSVPLLKLRASTLPDPRKPQRLPGPRGWNEFLMGS